MSGMNCTVEDIVRRFRIVTNGLRFRVERLEWRGHLWWRKQKWIPLCHYNPFGDLSYPIEFKTRGEAQNRIDRDVRELQAKLHGWKPDTSNAKDEG